MEGHDVVVRPDVHLGGIQATDASVVEAVVGQVDHNIWSGAARERALGRDARAIGIGGDDPVQDRRV